MIVKLFYDLWQRVFKKLDRFYIILILFTKNVGIVIHGNLTKLNSVWKDPKFWLPIVLAKFAVCKAGCQIDIWFQDKICSVDFEQCLQRPSARAQTENINLLLWPAPVYYNHINYVLCHFKVAICSRLGKGLIKNISKIMKIAPSKMMSLIWIAKQIKIESVWLLKLENGPTNSDW